MQQSASHQINDKKLRFVKTCHLYTLLGKRRAWTVPAK